MWVGTGTRKKEQVKIGVKKEGRMNDSKEGNLNDKENTSGEGGVGSKMFI